ncbi:MAG: hypothetical protein JWP34_4512 [Massilia sp.]|jgi:hypothetical protein|nr:hypothetical protein [Massilia sp.]
MNPDNACRRDKNRGEIRESQQGKQRRVGWQITKSSLAGAALSGVQDVQDKEPRIASFTSGSRLCNDMQLGGSEVSLCCHLRVSQKAVFVVKVSESTCERRECRLILHRSFAIELLEEFTR